MHKRSFMAAILVAGAAPSIVRAGSIMRLNPRIVAPEWEIFQSYEAGRISANRIRISPFLQGPVFVNDIEPYRVVTAYRPNSRGHLIERRVFDSRGRRVAYGERYL